MVEQTSIVDGIKQQEVICVSTKNNDSNDSLASAPSIIFRSMEILKQFVVLLVVGRKLAPLAA
jgi:hypothetical protein